MPYIPVGYGQASLNFDGLNLPHGGAIVIGFSNAGLQTPVACATDIFNATAAIVDNMCTSDVTLRSCDVKMGPNDTGAIATFNGTPTAGAVGGTSLSPGSAILVEKQTAIGGRRGRGRCYWPGVYDGWVTDAGLFESGVQAQIDGFMLNWLAGLSALDVPMFLLHSPSYTWTISNGQPRRVYGSLASAGDPDEVTSLVTDPIIATQRRRLR